MPNLYELSSEWAQLAHDLDESGGELTLPILERIEGMEGLFTDKADAICRIIRDAKTDVCKYRAELDRLTMALMTRQNTAERLTKYLQECMERAGLTRLETETPFKLTVCQNGRPSIEWVLGTDHIPERYRKVTVVEDRQLAYLDYKEGLDLPEGFSITHGKHLRIS
jgi:hypothetical protein